MARNDTHEVDLRDVHASFDTRPRPEKVAASVARLLHGKLTPDEQRLIGMVARYAERWSFMSEDWERPTDAAHALRFVEIAFDGLAEMPKLDPADSPALRDLHASLGGAIGWRPEGRRLVARPEGISHRRFNRAWRSLDALNEKLGQIAKVELRRSCALAARAGLAPTITLEEAQADPDAASFAAYYVAKRNVRRGFSIDGTDNPYDDVAAMLFDRLGEGTDWWLVARAYPTAVVVARLTEEQRGRMIGSWWSIMSKAASMCEQIDRQAPVNRAKMIVERGQDSDSWNLAAGAYNVARGSWVSALAATGNLDLLDVVCPPKLPRLMAADLIAWHRMSGGEDTHIDVRVAALLPPAWDVVLHGTGCTRAEAERACHACGLSDQLTLGSGWVGPKDARQRGSFTPTPELVHGIMVGDPILASILRRAGVWSGGEVRWDQLPDDLPADLGRAHDPKNGWFGR